MRPWLKQGRIVYCWVDDLQDVRAKKGRWKYGIILRLDKRSNDLKMVQINSGAPVEMGPNLRVQVRISSKDYPFFRRAFSFINCLMLVKKPLRDLEREMKSRDQTQDCGRLRDEHLRQVISKVLELGDISNRDRATISTPITGY